MQKYRSNILPLILLSLSLALCQPEPAIALREMGIDTPTVRTNLKRSLTAGLEEFQRMAVVETPAFVRPLLLNPAAKILLLGARASNDSGDENLDSNFTRLWAINLDSGRRNPIKRNLRKTLTDTSYHTKEIISGPSGERIYFFQRYAEVIGPTDRILAYVWRSGNEVVPPITLKPGEFAYDIAISRNEKILYALLFDQSSESWIIRMINLNNLNEHDLHLALRSGRYIDSNMPTQFIVSPDNATFYLTFSMEANKIHSYDSAGIHKQVFTANDKIADNYSLGGKRLAISPDGRTLYAVTRHGDLEVFDAVTTAKTAGPIRLAPPSHGPLSTIDLQVEPEGSPIVLSVGLGFADGGPWYHRVDQLEKPSGPQPFATTRLLPAPADPKAGLEENGNYQFLLRCKLPSITDREEARRFHLQLRTGTLQPKLAKHLNPKAFELLFNKPGSVSEYTFRYVALMEALYNVVFHGQGGYLEIFKTGDGALVARLIDRGPGIADPDELLSRSRLEHLTAADLGGGVVSSGFGFANIADGASHVTIESMGNQWDLSEGFTRTGSSEIWGGAVITLTFDRLGGLSAWQSPFRKSSEGLPPVLGHSAEALISSSLRDPEVSALLNQRGWAAISQNRYLVFPAKLESTPLGRLFLHSGLHKPQGLPSKVLVIPVRPKTVAGLNRFYVDRRVTNRDFILANLKILTPDEIIAAMPLIHPLPVVIGIPPWITLDDSDLQVMSTLSREVGPLFIWNIGRFTLDDGEVLLLIQA